MPILGSQGGLSVRHADGWDTLARFTPGSLVIRPEDA
jgi:hypothetical protein